MTSDSKKNYKEQKFLLILLTIQGDLCYNIIIIERKDDSYNGMEMQEKNTLTNYMGKVCKLLIGT